MIDWRKDTVTTFHATANAPCAANQTPTTTGWPRPPEPGLRRPTSATATISTVPGPSADTQRAGQETAGQRAETAGGQQDAVALLREVEDLERVQHERRQDRGLEQVQHAQHPGQGSQQVVAPEPAEAFGDVGPDRRARTAVVEAALRAERASKAQHCDRGEPERSGIEQERRRRCGREQEGAERRAHELIRHHLGRVAGGRCASSSASRSTTLGRIAWAALSNTVSAVPSDERDRRDQEDRLAPGQHEDSQGPDRHHADRVDDRHRTPPVDPVHHRAADEREQEPRQGAGQGHDGDARRRASQ